MCSEGPHLFIHLFIAMNVNVEGPWEHDQYNTQPCHQEAPAQSKTQNREEAMTRGKRIPSLPGESGKAGFETRSEDGKGLARRRGQ